MTIVWCNLDFTTNYSRVKGKMFSRCDLGLLNHKTLISVYPYWLDAIDIDYLGLLQALVVADA